MARNSFHHLTIKGFLMKQSLMTFCLLVSTCLLNSPMQAAAFLRKRLFSWYDEGADSTDETSKKRAEAFETLKQYPKLMTSLQQNKDQLALTPVKRPPAQRPVSAPIPTQTVPPSVHKLLEVLKQEQEKSPNRPFIVSVNVNNQSLYSDSSTETCPNAPVLDPPQQLSLSSLATEGIKWAQTHKMLCLLYSLIACYGGVNMYITSIEKYLNQEDTWSRWKYHLSLEELYRIGTPALLEDIVKIKQCSVEPVTSSTGTLLLKQSLQEIQGELSTLMRYKSFIAFAEYLPLSSFLVRSSGCSLEISSRIQRLLYLKNSILSFFEKQNSTTTAPLT